MVLLLLEVWKLLIGDNHCFYNSGTNCGGGASCTNNKFGDPGFINPDTGNYHIGLASAAIDQGIDAKVLTDIYREPRPLRFGCDIGADELPFPPVANFTGPTSSWIDDKVQFINKSTCALVTHNIDRLPAHRTEVIGPAGTWQPYLGFLPITDDGSV